MRKDTIQMKSSHSQYSKTDFSGSESPKTTKCETPERKRLNVHVSSPLNSSFFSTSTAYFDDDRDPDYRPDDSYYSETDDECHEQ